MQIINLYDILLFISQAFKVALWTKASVYSLGDPWFESQVEQTFFSHQPHNVAGISNRAKSMKTKIREGSN